MNKTQLVDALAERLGGDRRTAVTAVDGLLQTIVDTVRAGEQVSLTGFGVFEGRARAARTARNPRTGEAVPVPATTVPAFRAGATFRSAVADATPASSAVPAAAKPGVDVPARPGKAAKGAAGTGKGAKAAKSGKPAKDTKSAKAVKKAPTSAKAGGRSRDKGKRAKVGK